MANSRGNTGGRWLVRYGLAMVTLLSACTRFDRVSPPAAPSHRRLEVHFVRPTELVGQGGDAARVVRPRVRRAVGRALAVRNDSLMLEVHQWDSGDRSQRESPPFVAAIPLNCVDLGTRHFSGRRTVAAILSAPVVLWVLLLIMCELGQCPIPST